jgi:superfamily II DNA or RNA helicase
MSDDVMLSVLRLFKGTKKDYEDKDTFLQLFRNQGVNMDKYVDMLYDDDENNSDTESDTIFEDVLDEEPCSHFVWRPNQLKGLQKNIENHFRTGVHIQIMGAGKSNMILKSIYDKFKYDKKEGIKRAIYVIVTERTEILSKWLFKENGDLDENKIQKWKNFDIIDFSVFHVINTLFIKDKNWAIHISQIENPVLLIANSAYFRKDKKYEYLKDKVSLVCYDECHGISGKENYQAIKYLKENGASIIGFSATPLRNTKVSHSNLMNIFGINGRLNIISFYHLAHALRDDIVLPFKFVVVKAKVKQKGNVAKVSIDEDLLTRVLNRELQFIPYKKGIAWSRSVLEISQAGKYNEMFKRRFPDLKVYYTHHKEKTQEQIDKFYEEPDNAIMLCVNRLREGSDVPNVDFGVYIDRVKKRASHVGLQSSGRIIRHDEERRKRYGLVVDNIVFDDKPVELQTVEKVLSYYDNIMNLSDCNLDDIQEDIQEYRNMVGNAIINEEESEIRIKVDNNPRHDLVIKMEIGTIDWNAFREYLQQKVNEKTEMTREEQFMMIINRVKEYVNFNKDSHFWEMYDAIPDKKEKGLPENIRTEYKDMWDTRTWYEVLGLEVKNEWWNVDKSKKVFHKIKELVTKQMYLDYRKTNNKLPPYPEEFFRLYKFQEYETFF